MPTSSPAVRHIRRAATLCDDDLSDAQLLDGFLATRDEAAFEALVRRHGPMVLGVCRRVVGNAADADDAFQATFLVLVRRAAAVADRDLLGNWLYGVAFRTALEARSRMVRRRAKEVPVAELPDPAAEPDDASPELLALLDRELSRLPDKYRVPVVLCELEGASRKAVARRLGIPEGTLSSRLAAARRLLADRLTRRGVTVGAAAVAAALSQTDAPAMVPAPLIGSTVRAALDLAAGASTSAPVAALTQGVLNSMFLTKLKLTAAIVTAVGIAAGALTYGVASYKSVAAAPPDGGKADPDKPKPKGVPPKSDKDALQGAWKVTGVKSAGPQPDKDMVFYFAKDKAYIGTAQAVEADGNLTIDSTASPKQITLTLSRENRGALTGIYELDGNKLKLAFAEKPGADRPKDFEGGSGSICFLLERDPNAKMPDPTKMGNKLKNAAARQVSTNNIKQMVLAMHNYLEQNKEFPAAAIVDKNGKPLLSWRVAILPYIDQDALYKEFKLDEPWDSETNKKAMAQMPRVYGEKGTKTHYRVFTGKGTMFEGTKGVKISDVTDGTSNTAMIFEAADAVEWTKPEEFEYDAKTPLPKLGGVPYENGFLVGFADGSVRFISTKAKEATIRAIITRNGGEVIDPNKEQEEE
jgi:RNA polymerase sigma factor (sigma-70 family)